MRLTSTVNMNPARLAGESRQDYIDRRKAQKLRVRLITKGPRQPKFVPHVKSDGNPAVPNMVHWWLGQWTNPDKNHHRRAVAAAGGIRQYKKQARTLRQMLSSQASTVDPVAWNNLQAA